MPIYEYQCKACCHCFEELVFSSTPEAQVPQVRLREVQKLMSAGCVRPRNPHGSGGFKPLLQALRRLTDIDLPSWGNGFAESLIAGCASFRGRAATVPRLPASLR